jgi:protoporphyrinogen oxidase
MNNVVIIGGGLSGLAAAVELEALKIPYTLIEVKGRLGGGICTLHRDGFTLDTGSFAFPRTADWSFLDEFGLKDALIPVNDWHQQRMVAFKEGTQTLTDALASRVTNTVIHKMAVSSLGDFEGNRFALCMENGLMLEARALIVTAPARHVERMFRTLAPEFSLRLLNYGYDIITRVALGFTGEVRDPGRMVWGDIATAFFYSTDDPNRVPPGHSLVQMGVRFPLERTTPERLVAVLREHLNWPEPAFSQVSTWAEADPLPPHGRNFREQMIALESLLPEGVALAGSDFNGLGLPERVAGGRSAARKIAAWLEAKA